MKTILIIISAITILPSCENADREKNQQEILRQKVEGKNSQDVKSPIKYSAKDSASVLTYEQLDSILPIIKGYTLVGKNGSTLENKKSFALANYQLDASRLLLVSINDMNLLRGDLDTIRNMYRRNLTVPNKGLISAELSNKNASTFIIAETNSENNFHTVRAFTEDNYIINLMGNDKTSIPYLKNLLEEVLQRLNAVQKLARQNKAD